MNRLIASSIAAIFSVALYGCVTAQGQVSALPPLKQYSKQWQAGLKQELPTVRQCCPRANEAIKDYSTLRDQLRAGQRVQQRAKPKGGFLGLFKGR